MAKKEEFISKIDQTNLALVAVGSGGGIATSFLLREYADDYLPQVIPGDFIPPEWNKISVLSSLGIGAASLITSIFAKNYRYALLPLGISTLSCGILFGLFPKTPAAGLPLSAGQRAGSNIKLKYAGAGQRAGNVKLTYAGAGQGAVPGLKPAGSNFMQKSPEARLLQLKKESQDLETAKEVEKLEAELTFKKQGNQGIPLRT